MKRNRRSSTVNKCNMPCCTQPSGSSSRHELDGHTSQSPDRTAKRSKTQKGKTRPTRRNLISPVRATAPASDNIRDTDLSESSISAESSDDYTSDSEDSGSDTEYLHFNNLLRSHTNNLAGFIEVCVSFDSNCDYLDTSRKDRTSQLECENYGCCGDFKNRHCCVGPIPIVAGIFGSILLILIVAVIIGACCAHQKKNQRTLPVPTITAEMYNDIPLPSPPSHVPLVYNPARLHPPSLVTHPFRHVKPAEGNQNHPPPSKLHPPRLKAFRS